MMEIIEITKREPIQGYATAAAAIAAAKAHPLQSLARADGARLEGRCFVGAQCAREKWSIEFTGPVWLHVAARDGEVEWVVNEIAPTFESQDEPYLLCWPCGIEAAVEPRVLVADRVGATFWHLFVNEVGFYVYLRTKLILWFHGETRTEDGSDVLYISEDD